MNIDELSQSYPKLLVLQWEKDDINEELRKELEVFFQQQIAFKPRFSREDIYHHGQVNRAFCMSFWPTSESYSKYGHSVIAEAVLGTEEELLELIQNTLNRIPTSGKMKIFITERNKDEEIEINSNDVYEIVSMNH